MSNLLINDHDTKTLILKTADKLSRIAATLKNDVDANTLTTTVVNQAWVELDDIVISLSDISQ